MENFSALPKDKFTSLGTREAFSLFFNLYVPVAQLDRVSDSDSEGRAFESHRAYQKKDIHWMSFFNEICLRQVK